MKKYLLILFLYSCATTKPNTVQRSMVLSVPTMTNRQLTDYVLNQDLSIQGQQETIQKQDSVNEIQSNRINELERTSVWLDKNFRIDSSGRATLADTIYINAIIVKGKVLYVGVENQDSTLIKSDTLAPIIIFL